MNESRCREYACTDPAYPNSAGLPWCLAHWPENLAKPTPAHPCVECGTRQAARCGGELARPVVEAAEALAYAHRHDFVFLIPALRRAVDAYRANS